MGVCAMKADKITRDVLEAHFHWPLATAARKIGVSVTHLKTVCRRNGVLRWPYRQVRAQALATEGFVAAESQSAFPRGAKDESTPAVYIQNFVSRRPNNKRQREETRAMDNIDSGRIEAATHSRPRLPEPDFRMACERLTGHTHSGGKPTTFVREWPSQNRHPPLRDEAKEQERPIELPSVVQDLSSVARQVDSVLGGVVRTPFVSNGASLQLSNRAARMATEKWLQNGLRKTDQMARLQADVEASGLKKQCLEPPHKFPRINPPSDFKLQFNCLMPKIVQALAAVCKAPSTEVTPPVNPKQAIIPDIQTDRLREALKGMQALKTACLEPQPDAAPRGSPTMANPRMSIDSLLVHNAQPAMQ